MQEKKKVIWSHNTKDGDYEQALTGLSNNEIEVLFLDKYDLNNLNIDRLIEQLKVNASLRVLEFCSCNVYDDSVIKLFEGLNHNTTLTNIQFYGDATCIKITDTAAAHIANYLATNTSLTSLIIQDSQIQEAGAEDLAKALYTNETMSTLHIGGQNITSEGARALWTAASRKGSRIVSFVTCPFSEEQWYKESVGKVHFKRAVADQAAFRWLAHKEKGGSIEYAPVFDTYSTAIKSYLRVMGRTDLAASYEAEVKALNLDR